MLIFVAQKVYKAVFKTAIKVTLYLLLDMLRGIIAK